MTLRKSKPLKRRVRVREPRARFYIFCEGANTEPDYLKAVKTKYRSALIDLEISGGKGVPRTLADLAKNRALELGLIGRKRTHLDSFEKGDQVWICFDRDEHERIEEAFQICKVNNIGVAFSNPCFEPWIILHFEFFDKACDRHTRVCGV